jgi:hypothetical protein
VANTGVPAQPTAYRNLSDPNFQLPTNLRSHSDQVVMMQTGFSNAGGTSGWGGRTLDGLQAHNGATSFPVSISMDNPAIYCVGAVTQNVTLEPNNDLRVSHRTSAYGIVGRFERGLCPRNEMGEASEGAAEAPSDQTKRLDPYRRSSTWT